MRKGLPGRRAAALALGRRVRRWLGRDADPFADVPPGLNLSPSASHFADYETAPLALRYAARRVPRAVVVEAWPGDPRWIDRLLGPAPDTN